MSEPLNLFFAYARADQALRDELDKHLAFLRRSNLIKGWYDGDISAGEDWQQAIHDHLHTADIILLLVSPDFIASEYCYDVEMKKAMARHEAGEAVVIPIILRPCRWKYAPFGKLQALPKDAKPVSRWSDSDDAFDNVAETIDTVVCQLRPQRNFPPPSDKREMRINQLREQIEIHKNELHLYETRAAKYGFLDNPPRLFHLIEGTKRKIEELENELYQLENNNA